MFDPSKPADYSPNSAAEMRAQLNGLKADIDAIPGLTAVVVDSITTVGPGEPASVTVSVIGTVLHLSLAIPRGADGLQGVPGLQGPPFANVVIDSITTLDPGVNAAVFVYFDGTLVHLSFAIPRGAQGEQGIQGIQGIQGPPGEVTNAALADAMAIAVAGTANNTNGVATLDTPFADNPDAEALRLKLNELILAQRR